MRSKNKKGVRVEKGEVIDFDYTGPVLRTCIRRESSNTEHTTYGKVCAHPRHCGARAKQERRGYRRIRDCGRGRNGGFRSGLSSRS
jgi:hypothetical protein